MPRYTRIFKDLDLTFTPHPVTGDIVKRYDENAIKMSIINLILTQKYERAFHPEISSRATDLLFEPFSLNIASVISQTIREVIKNHEPRGQIVSISTDADSDENGYKITIRFKVNNQPEPLTIETFLRRVR